MLYTSCKKSSNGSTTPVNNIVDTLGIGWTKVVSPLNKCNDISFINHDTGYLLGDSKTLKSVDGGKTWQDIPSSVGGINFGSTSDGKLFILNYYPNPVNFFQSYNYGNSFTHLNDSLSDSNANLFFTSNNCYIITGSNKIYKSTNGGTNWNKLIFPIGLNLSPNSIKSLFFLNDSIGWVSDGYSIYKINGNSCQYTYCSINTPRSLSNYHNAIAANTISSIYLSYFDGTGSLAVAKSVDSGVSFNLINHLPIIFNSGISWIDSYFYSDSIGFISINNRVYHTTDGGNTWNVVVELSAGDIVESYFIDDKHGWVCCSDGTVLIYKQ